ncbi:sigma-70 family RNA polymerase sigma factor [Solicola gregarius]|uniref:Sigma-70 family RNA polymerase sigma factor n=1 Tax=Solicola gregarius TaxID=2908642 RepID=A0AA46YMG0_9ACTN|nr:sigma-70 family RNA polymerase sigma factor [Solicola gregarius]UYM06491.1 sigma-70 family RNA polymerase sigma factor [Solicola gregarius]
MSDDAEFAAMFQGHATRVVRLAALLGADDPEDVAQEAFCRLYAARDRVDDRAVAYLNRIVVNEVRSRHRRNQTARRARLQLVELPTPIEHAGAYAERSAVIDAINTLPSRKREALVLRYWLDLPLAEIADAMGVRLGTVKSLLSRGLDALANELGETR